LLSSAFLLRIAGILRHRIIIDVSKGRRRELVVHPHAFVFSSKTQICRDIYICKLLPRKKPAPANDSLTERRAKSKIKPIANNETPGRTDFSQFLILLVHNNDNNGAGICTDHGPLGRPCPGQELRAVGPPGGRGRVPRGRARAERVARVRRRTGGGGPAPRSSGAAHMASPPCAAAINGVTVTSHSAHGAPAPGPPGPLLPPRGLLRAAAPPLPP
jgi:hypothetical protein